MLTTPGLVEKSLAENTQLNNKSLFTTQDAVLSWGRVKLIDWFPRVRGSLVGFAKVRVPELGLVIDGVSVHKHGDKRWVALPAKPQVDPTTGNTIRDTAGRVQYCKNIRLDGPSQKRFGAAIWRAVSPLLKENTHGR
jgi:hypothetical protein